MDHLCVSAFQFMNHGYTQTSLSMSKCNITNPISFCNMDMKSHSSTLHALTGPKSFLSQEELTIRPMKNSQLVGGFVGSKSQLGTSNRMSCQIWDIVFCKLMSLMSPSSIKAASSLESSDYSYAFVQDLTTDMLDSMYRDITQSNTHMTGSCAVTTDNSMLNKVTPMNSEKPNLLAVSAMGSTPISVPQHEPCNVKQLESSKQSYADVTKAVKHTEMKGNAKHENTFYSRSSISEIQMIAVQEINNSSKRKKQNCRRKKAGTIPNYNAAKPQSDSKKERSKFHKNDQRKASNLRAQNASTKQKNRTMSEAKSDSSINVECDGNDALIDFKSSNVNENISMNFKRKQKSCISGMSNKGDSQNKYTNSHVKNILADTSQNSIKKGGYHESMKMKEEGCLIKKPFSHLHEISSHKPNRFNSDSSDSDDFVIFAIAETDMVQNESGVEEDNGDCFSECDMEEIWDVQEKDTDEVDNQVTEDLKKINEKWQKMYSCFPGKPKEPKKVQFASNEKLKTVHSIIAWDFAYRAARIGPWQQIALDQDRFMHRILKLEQIISPVLTIEHRLYVRQRTMKYLNAVNSEN